MSDDKPITTIAEVVEHDLEQVPFDADCAEATGMAGMVPQDYRTVHASKLLALKREALELPAIIDKDSLEANHKFRMRLVKIRTGIDAARKAITAPMRELKGKVDGYLGTDADSGLQGQIKALEVPIEKAQAAWEEEQERIRQEALRIIRERNEARAKRVIAAGMTFDGVAYMLGYLQLFPADLNGWDDTTFGKWCNDYLFPAAEEAAEEAAADEAQRRKDKEEAQREENARQRAEFQRQAAERKRMDDERAELDRQKAELRAEKNRVRADELVMLGAEEHCTNEGVVIRTLHISVPTNTLADIDEAKWSGLKDRMRADVVVVMAQMKETARREEHLDKRSGKLMVLGAAYDGDSVWTLGDATVTDHQLRYMIEEEWVKVLDEFQAARKMIDDVQQLQEAAAAEVFPEGTPEGTATIHIAQPNVIDEEDPPVDEKQRMLHVLDLGNDFLEAALNAEDATSDAIRKQAYGYVCGSAAKCVEVLKRTIEEQT